MPDKRQPHHTHDRGYRELLSSKRAFLELIKTFVPGNKGSVLWVYT